MYADAVTWLHETVFPVVPDLEKVQSGEPVNAHKTPLLYTLFGGFTKNDVAYHYSVMLRLAIPVPPEPIADLPEGDPGPLEVVETMIAPFVNSIPAAIREQCRLSPPAFGMAQVTAARSGEDEGFIAIGGTLCRCITFDVEITEKIRNQPGL